MRFNRRRSDRPDSARSRLGSGLETLETRELLTHSGSGIFSVYQPRDLVVNNPITNQPVKYSVVHQLNSNPGEQSSLFNNQGKILSGKDRAGDEWTITVHGPGYAVVTTTSPNSGTLSDDIDTITLVGTDINKTYVTGNVVASFRIQTPGTIPFNRLVALDGVKSVILNGFDLQQTVAPAAGTPNNLNTGIFLLGGVQYLQFHDINAPINVANTDAAVNVVIGDPTTPLPASVKPTIVLDSINNTVFNTAVTTVPALTPQTTPTVNIIVNGEIQTLSLTSATGDVATVLGNQAVDPSENSSLFYLYPTVASTGRTSVQATGINNLYVFGAATNVTASRTSPPFQNGFTGLNHLNTATFNGPVDAVGLDVNGPVGRLVFNKGIGSTTGVFNGTTASGSQVPASGYGTVADQSSYAAAGLISGQVTATRIKSVTINPSSVVTQTPLNPDFVQINGIGTIYQKVRPGTAAVNALIVSSGNIGRTTVTGNLVNTEIKAGFHYPSFAAGLEGTRAASTVGPVKQNGSLINGVVSSTYRPFMNFYNSTGATAGPGKVVGNVTGTAVNTNSVTPLGNTGAGVYARTKIGKLPST